jgi:protein O-GlcNAcase/histone acetyltransferase
VAGVIGRKPVIWENFHANDYDIRRVYAGPLGGRNPAILDWIDGIITNPNNEFEANYVAVHSTGALARGGYDEATAFAAALKDWAPRFALAFEKSGARVSDEDIRLLAEICYQPFRCGPQIETLLEVARGLLSEHRPQITPDWLAGFGRIIALRDRIRHLFEAMTELENRDLFYAFHPYLWEAREEVTHLVSYLDWLSGGPPADEVFPDRERIYNFYRRGFTVAVQELLPRDRAGHYHHAA